MNDFEKLAYAAVKSGKLEEDYRLIKAFALGAETQYDIDNSQEQIEALLRQLHEYGLYNGCNSVVAKMIAGAKAYAKELIEEEKKKL